MLIEGVRGNKRLKLMVWILIRSHVCANIFFANFYIGINVEICINHRNSHDVTGSNHGFGIEILFTCSKQCESLNINFVKHIY